MSDVGPRSVLTWINAKYCGSCWLCRAEIMQGDKVGVIYSSIIARVLNKPAAKTGMSRFLCHRCGNAYAARMAEAEESRRAAYGAAAKLGGD